MKTLFIIFLLTFALIITWGCKKDSIVDDITLDTIDSLAWNNSIAGRYLLKGLRYNNVANVYTSDSTEVIITVVVNSDSAVSLFKETTVWANNVERVFINTKKSTYANSGFTSSGLTDTEIIFINNDVDSMYYKKEVRGLSSASTNYYAGVRVP